MTDAGCKLSVRFLGRVEIRVDDQLVRPRTRDATYLMALLVAHHGEEMTRESVAERLWPKADERTGSHNLRRTLWDLRRTLECAGDRVIVTVPSRNLRLDVAKADVDVVQFDRAIRRGDIESLRQAVDAYTGPFLEGCADAWAVEERNNRQQAVVKALDTLAHEAGNSGSPSAAMDYRRQSARIAPLDRPSTEGTSKAPAGSPDVEAYRSFQRSLKEDERAGQRPPPKEPGAAAAARKDPADVLQIGPPLPKRRPLPTPRTRLVGRDGDVDRVMRLLGERRLVTLTGPGGAGKTRLALAVAHKSQDRFAQGAVFVELAALTDPALVGSTTAYRLALPVDAGRSATETIIRSLQRVPILIVLDNCDGVRDATARFAEEILAACPDVCVLVTCRKLLQTPSESIQAVLPLRTPPEGVADPAAIARFPAVDLFVELAAAAPGDSRPAAEAASSVSAICRRLGGVPIAIELAAAAARAMTPAALDAALEEQIGRTSFGAISGMARDRAMTSMVDWSYSRLSPDEQTLLRRVSIFSGGWTADAADKVCRDDDAAADGRAETVSLLDSLADHQLVIRDEASGRYDLLDTVRQVLRERMLPDDETRAIRIRHHAYFHHFAGLTLTMAELQADVENLRQALDWSLSEPGSGRSGVAICAVFAVIAFERDVYTEMRGKLTELLQRPDLQRPSRERAHGLEMLGYFALKQGDIATALPHVRESVTVAQRVGDKKRQRDGLRVVGEAEELSGDLTAARLALEKSVALSRAAADLPCLAEALRLLGCVWERIGNLDEAERHLQEALTLMEEAQHAGGSFVLVNLGSVAFRRGEYAEARAYGRRMLLARRAVDSRAQVEDGLELMARVAVAEGQFYRAARLYGAMMRIVELIGGTKYWSKRLDFVARIRAVQHILGEDVYDKAHREGEEMTWQEAVAFALEERGG